VCLRALAIYNKFYTTSRTSYTALTLESSELNVVRGA